MVNNEEFDGVDLVRASSKKSSKGKIKQTSVSARSLIVKKALIIGIVFSIGFIVIGAGVFNAIGAFLGH